TVITEPFFDREDVPRAADVLGEPERMVDRALPSRWDHAGPGVAAVEIHFVALLIDADFVEADPGHCRNDRQPGDRRTIARRDDRGRQVERILAARRARRHPDLDARGAP